MSMTKNISALNSVINYKKQWQSDSMDMIQEEKSIST